MKAKRLEFLWFLLKKSELKLLRMGIRMSIASARHSFDGLPIAPDVDLPSHGFYSALIKGFRGISAIYSIAGKGLTGTLKQQNHAGSGKTIPISEWSEWPVRVLSEPEARQYDITLSKEQFQKTALFCKAVKSWRNGPKLCFNWRSRMLAKSFHHKPFVS